MAIRVCRDDNKGLGMFAARRLAKGPRISTEVPVVRYNNLRDAIDHIEQDFEFLSENNKARLIRLFAGGNDVG